MRTIIELTDEQIEALKRYCAREHVSRAEAVRRAVDGIVNDDKERAFKAAFGAWKDNPLDADTHIQQIRAEWER